MVTNNEPDAPLAETAGTKQLTHARGSGFGLFITIILGTVIGGLIAKIGGYEFRLYVRTFHSHTSSGSLFLAIAETAQMLRPVAWFSPVLFSIFYCCRSHLRFGYILLFGLVGWSFGFAISSYVHANPGPNYHTSIYNVPISCFLATIVGAVIQVAKWYDSV